MKKINFKILYIVHKDVSRRMELNLSGGVPVDLHIPLVNTGFV